jgi:hypothetical protein
MAHKRKHSRLVAGHLERSSVRLFQSHTAELKALIGGQHGLYALYRKDRLYYVGLAKNLFARLRQHTRDKHRGKWDAFSAYLTSSGRVVKELESLALRVLMPGGNRVNGRFQGSANLTKELLRLIDERNTRTTADLVGGVHSRTIRTRVARGQRGAKQLAVLAGRHRRLWGRRKGVDYQAVLRKNGSIRFRGVTYSSPTAAARAAVGSGQSGWSFWMFKNERGEWAPLRRLGRA